MKKRNFFKTIILILIIGVPLVMSCKSSSEELILIPVQKGATWRFVSPNSKKEILCIYDGVLAFSEGLAAVFKNGKCGYINEKGRVIVPIEYDDGWPFSEGFAAVRKGEKWGIIDTKGKTVIKFIYDDIIWP